MERRLMKKVTVIPPISAEEEEALRKHHNKIWKQVPNGRRPVIEIDVSTTSGKRTRKSISPRSAYSGYDG